MRELPLRAYERAQDCQAPIRTPSTSLLLHVIFSFPFSALLQQVQALTRRQERSSRLSKVRLRRRGGACDLLNERNSGSCLVRFVGMQKRPPLPPPADHLPFLSSPSLCLPRRTRSPPLHAALQAPLLLPTHPTSDADRTRTMFLQRLFTRTTPPLSAEEQVKLTEQAEQARLAAGALRRKSSPASLQR